MSSGVIKNKDMIPNGEILDVDEWLKKHNRTLQRIYFKQLSNYISELFKSKNTHRYSDISNVVVSFLSLSKKRVSFDIEDFRSNPKFKLALRKELS